ncbi:hypothetical protein [Nocardia tengchongensis]
MIVELFFAAATVILCALAAMRMNHDAPVARHGRDRYSVAAIRARIESENRAAALTIRPVGRVRAR